jgi:hypothetical protein
VIIVLLLIIGTAVCTPVAAAVLVSVASRCEESAWTLGGPPPGLVQAVGRRIVAFHGPGIGGPAQGSGTAGAPEQAGGPARAAIASGSGNW